MQLLCTPHQRFCSVSFGHEPLYLDGFIIVRVRISEPTPQEALQLDHGVHGLITQSTAKPEINVQNIVSLKFYI